MELDVMVEAQLAPGMCASSYVYEGGKPILTGEQEGESYLDWYDN
ncbi:hypothetical protein [Streptomyces sp. NPDC051909]